MAGSTVVEVPLGKSSGAPDTSVALSSVVAASVASVAAISVVAENGGIFVGNTDPQSIPILLVAENIGMLFRSIPLL